MLSSRRHVPLYVLYIIKVPHHETSTATFDFVLPDFKTPLLNICLVTTKAWYPVVLCYNLTQLTQMHKKCQNALIKRLISTKIIVKVFLEAKYVLCSGTCSGFFSILPSLLHIVHTTKQNVYYL